MVAVDLLEDARFTVAEAATVDEARAILKRWSDTGVLLIDVERPGSMNGFALAEPVAERWPQVRLVITTGRCHPVSRGVPDNGMFVPKPYLVDQVLSALERARLI